MPYPNPIRRRITFEKVLLNISESEAITNKEVEY
jgi:hypothetical protein